MPSGVAFHDSPCPSTVRISHLFTIGTGKPFGFRTFYQYVGAARVPSGAINSLAGDALTAWNTNLKPMQSSTISMQAIVVTDLGFTDGAQATLPTSSPGTKSGAANSPANCALVNYKISRRYRGGHGRTYLPIGVQLDQLDPTHWTSAFLTSATSAWAAYTSAIVGQTHVPMTSQVIVSYFSGAQPNGPGNVWGPANVPEPRILPDGTPAPQPQSVTSWSIATKVGQQQRRAGYR